MSGGEWTLRSLPRTCVLCGRSPVQAELIGSTGLVLARCCRTCGERQVARHNSKLRNWHAANQNAPRARSKPNNQHKE